MKITLQNSRLPFTGNLIEMLNLSAGVERFKIQSAPFVGEILFDGSKRIEMTREIGGEEFEKKTGIFFAFVWSDDGRLVRIHVGSKWTGPMLSWEGSNGKWFACFSNGNHGNNFASGGTWSGVASLNDTHRTTTEQERAAGAGILSGETNPARGFPTMESAVAYRFGSTRNQTRKFTESDALAAHVMKTLSEIT